MNASGFLVPVMIAATAVMFLLTIVFNGLSGSGNSALFPTTMVNISDKYRLMITPAGWAFSIWGLIYFLLAAAVIYFVSSIFRKYEWGRLFRQRPTLSWLFYTALTINFACNITWVFVWMNEYMVAATIVIAFIPITAWTAIGLSCYECYQTMESIDIINAKETVREVRIQKALLHNGIAVYATWTTIATLLNFGMALQYVGEVDDETTSLVCSGLLLAIMAVWFVVENVFVDKYVRHVLTQYPVVIFATSAILDLQRFYTTSGDEIAQQFPVADSVSDITWAVLGVSIAFFVLRIIIVSLRFKYRPLHSNRKVY